MPNELDEKELVSLDSQQRSVAYRVYQGPALVKGLSGTGKTLVGLHWAAARARRNRQRRIFAEDLDLPVLFTSFIRTFPPAMERSYCQLPGTRRGEVEFINVDKLAWEICRAAGDEMRLEHDELDETFDDAFEQVVQPGTSLARMELSRRYLRDEIDRVIKGRVIDSPQEYLELSRFKRGVRLTRNAREQVWKLKETWEQEMRRQGTMHHGDVIARALCHARQMDKPWYSAVVVDEAQDLSLAKLHLLRALVNAPDHDIDRVDGLLLIGDGDQRIYPGGFTWHQAGIEVSGRTTVLKRNYRNTSQIINAAMAVCGRGFRHNEKETPIVAAREGCPPLLARINGLEAQVEDIARRINQWSEPGQGFSRGDMAVLVYTNRMARQVTHYLEDARLRVQPLSEYCGIPSEMVKVGTYDRSKSLEFKVVFLPELTSDMFPYPAAWNSNQEESAEQRQLSISRLFVAMTRARERLVVYYSGLPNEEIYAAKEHFQIV